jgi:hypothetical protein
MDIIPINKKNAQKNCNNTLRQSFQNTIKVLKKYHY